MKLFAAIRKCLSVSTLTLVLALGFAGYGTASLIAPDYLADVFGLLKDDGRGIESDPDKDGQGIEDGSV